MPGNSNFAGDVREVAAELERSKIRIMTKIEKFKHALPNRLRVQEENLPKNVRKDTSDPMVKLRKIYSVMGELYLYLKGLTACSIRCSACCYIPLSISDIEIKYIEQTTGEIAQPKKNPTRTIDKPAACPFLIDNVCSIYSARPLMCRKHFTLDDTSRWCQIPLCHDVSLAHMEFAGFLKAYDHVLCESHSRL